MTKELSDSLLAACKAAGIANPRYIAQDKDEPYVWHYDLKPDTSEVMWAVDNGNATKIHHPPYADDWQESLLEWVDHIADTSKMIDEYARRRTEAQVYERARQDALAWKGGGDQASGIEAMVCDDIAKRQQVGIAKYGTTVAENPLTHAQWLQHAYEECLDMAVYLKRAMAEKGGDQ